MADLNLSQADADALIALEKHRVSDERYDFPSVGASLTIPLQSKDKREQFLLDLGSSRIDLLKGRYQSRARQVVVLVRLDFGGAPHRNPDGEEVACPHLHLYREGYGDKWAVPVPPDSLSDTSNLALMLENFMQYCQVTLPPNIERGIFT